MPSGAALRPDRARVAGGQRSPSGRSSLIGTVPGVRDGIDRALPLLQFGPEAPSGHLGAVPGRDRSAARARGRGGRPRKGPEDRQGPPLIRLVPPSHRWLSTPDDRLGAAPGRPGCARGPVRPRHVRAASRCTATRPRPGWRPVAAAETPRGGLGPRGRPNASTRRTGSRACHGARRKACHRGLLLLAPPRIDEAGPGMGRDESHPPRAPGPAVVGRPARPRAAQTLTTLEQPAPFDPVRAASGHRVSPCSRPAPGPARPSPSPP